MSLRALPALAATACRAMPTRAEGLQRRGTAQVAIALVASAAAVRTAIDEMRGAGHFWQPVREMERAAIEPLPDLDHFLPWPPMDRQAG